MFSHPDELDAMDVDEDNNQKKEDTSNNKYHDGNGSKRVPTVYLFCSVPY